MTDDKQPKQNETDEQQDEQADLELDEEQTDEVKGGGYRFRGPDKEPESGRWRG